MARVKSVVIWLCALILTACASSGNENTYVGWHCSGEERAENWRCEQKLMKNGRPVETAEKTAADNTVELAQVKQQAPVEQTAVQQPSVQQAPAIESAGQPEVLPLEQSREQYWKDQLPDMDAAPKLGSSDDQLMPTGDVPQKIREPRKATSAFSDAPEPSGSQQKVRPAQEGFPAPKAKAANSAAGKTGYTVQLGAFDNDQQLNTFVEGHRLRIPGLTRYIITDEGRVWYVLAWGQFGTADVAKAKWQALGRVEPDIWVRSMASLYQRLGAQ